MPTNVTPQYREAEARYRAAKTPEEKLACLEEMLRIMPKHKGTDKLQADVKARIAKVRQQTQAGGRKHPAGHSHAIPREGAGQVALIGPPNSGKSSLLAALTHAHPHIADFPFTTKEPLPGMMPFEDADIQLVDLPPISREHVEPWVFDCARRADMLWLVVESGGAMDGIELCRESLAARHAYPVPPGGGGSHGAESGAVFLPAFLVVTMMDRPGSAENLALLRELVEIRWPLIAVSSRDGSGMEDLRRSTFEALGVIRVYTKEPGKPADQRRPFTLPRGATVADLAEMIHKDIARQLRFARVWGSGAFDGQQVHREHVLADRDIVELHA